MSSRLDLVVRWSAVWAMLVVAACAAAPAQQTIEHVAGPARVLFVGNSFTYYNDSLHNHLRRLMRAAAPAPHIPDKPRYRIMTISGSHLAEHSGLDSVLQAEPWDVVVLQGHSREAYDSDRLALFRSAVRQHARVIKQHGAQPMLFMTWAYTGEPEMTEVIASNYRAAGQETGARVAPVGLAFATVTREHPQIPLIHADRRHPTVQGSYLAACVFYSLFFETSPQGLDYTAGLEPEVAAILQRVAWETVKPELF